MGGTKSEAGEAMTEAEFKAAIAALRDNTRAVNALATDVAALREGQRLSREQHKNTQERIDRIGGELGESIARHIDLAVQPMANDIASLKKTRDDHESRLRDVEKKGIKRDAVLTTGAAGVAIAVTEAIRWLFKIKTGS